MTSTMIDTRMGEVVVPRGELAAARLVVRGGAAGLRIRSAGLGGALARLRFEGTQPTVTVADESVMLDFRGFDLPHPGTWFKDGPEVVLSHDVRWAIDVSGGVAGLHADLRSVPLDAVTLGGGVTDAQLQLPRPDRRVSVRVSGDVTKVGIRRPAAVSLQLRGAGSAIDVHCDGDSVPFAVGPWAWESSQFDTASSGYEVQIEGTATSLDVMVEPEPQ